MEVFEMSDGIDLFITHTGRVFMVEPQGVPHPRRAFIDNGSGGYDWCHAQELAAHDDRARLYAWHGSELPATMICP
jgi:hypothetical protein